MEAPMERTRATLAASWWAIAYPLAALALFVAGLAAAGS